MIAAQRAQAEAQSEAIFQELDKNNSGKLERNELISLAKQKKCMPEGSEEAQIDEIVKNFDTDDDGMVSMEEWKEFHMKAFDQIIERMFGSQFV